MDWKLELVVVPVLDVDRAKDFYIEKPAFTWTSTTVPVMTTGSCS